MFTFATLLYIIEQINNDVDDDELMMMMMMILGPIIRPCKYLIYTIQLVSPNFTENCSTMSSKNQFILI